MIATNEEAKDTATLFRPAVPLDGLVSTGSPVDETNTSSVTVRVVFVSVAVNVYVFPPSANLVQYPLRFSISRAAAGDLVLAYG